MYLLALSLCKILTEFLELILSYQDVPFSATKWPIYPEQFFWYKPLSYFHLPIGLFHCAKFTKNSSSQFEVVRIPHFWAHNGPFAPNNFFWENY